MGDGDVNQEHDADEICDGKTPENCNMEDSNPPTPRSLKELDQLVKKVFGELEEEIDFCHGEMDRYERKIGYQETILGKMVDILGLKSAFPLGCFSGSGESSKDPLGTAASPENKLFDYSQEPEEGPWLEIIQEVGKLKNFYEDIHQKKSVLLSPEDLAKICSEMGIDDGINQKTLMINKFKDDNKKIKELTEKLKKLKETPDQVNAEKEKSEKILEHIEIFTKIDAKKDPNEFTRFLIRVTRKGIFRKVIDAVKEKF